VSLHPVPDPDTRVLIACGEALRRGGYRAVLQGARGISVAGEATTGREAVELAGQLRPAAVLMDISIADYDCIEATEQLSEEPGVPVIVLGALEDDERMFGALRAGATGVLSNDTAAICEVLQLSNSNFWVMMHRARMGLRRCMELNWFRKA